MVAKREAGGTLGVRDFGGRIKRLRLRKRWTQEDLAAASGLDQASISLIENGRKGVSMYSVRKLAEAFGVPLAELAVEAGLLSPGEVPDRRDGGQNGTGHGPESGDIFDRAPLARLDAELKSLPTAPGQPTFAEQMQQLDRLPEERRARVIRRLARDFLWRLREELEREEEGGGD